MDQVYSWNVNSDRRIAKSWSKNHPASFYDAFSYCDFDARKEQIEAELLKFVSKKNSFVALQEVDGQMLEFLKAFCIENKFEILSAPYCLDSNSFHLVLMYKSQEGLVVKHTVCPLTKSGNYWPNSERFLPKEASENEKAEHKKKVIDHNLGEEFEKCSVFYQVFVEGILVLTLVNTHFPLKNSCKMSVAQRLMEYVKVLVPVNCPVIMVADWNQFDMDKNYPCLYKELIDFFKSSGMDFANETLFTHPLGATFCPWPYDILFRLSEEDRKTVEELRKNKDPKLRSFLLEKIAGFDTVATTQLDGVYTRGIDLSKCRLEMLGVDPQMTHEEFKTLYLKKHSEKECFPPSDHFPLCFTFKA